MGGSLDVLTQVAGALLQKDVRLVVDIAQKAERFTGADLEDVVRRAGLNAIRRTQGAPDNVAKADFDQALKDSRATVTEQMESEYAKMKGELKRKAMEVKPIGFITDGMVESTRDSKH